MSGAGSIQEELATTGSLEDVAGFFGVSERTVREWKAEGLIGSWKQGSCVRFGEEDVLDCWCRGRREASGLKPGEARERARREWREFLKLRLASFGLRVLEERLERLERLAFEPRIVNQTKEAA